MRGRRRDRPTARGGRADTLHDRLERRLAEPSTRVQVVVVLAVLLIAALACVVLAPDTADHGASAENAGLLPSGTFSRSHRNARPRASADRHLADLPQNTIPGVTSRCHYFAYTSGPVVGDRTCTPGAVDAAAASNPHDTICRTRYLRRAEASAHASREEMIGLYVAYGVVGPLSRYREDRLVAVADGGSAHSPENLWLAPVGELSAKHRVEAQPHRRIGAGAITVGQAARVLERDWSRKLPEP